MDFQSSFLIIWKKESYFHILEKYDQDPSLLNNYLDGAITISQKQYCLSPNK